MDLEALVTDELRDETARLRARVVRRRRPRRPPAARHGRDPHARGRVGPGDFTGDGPVDAIFRAINAATRREARLREFRIDAVTGGQDALGEASVVSSSRASRPPARACRPTSSRRRRSPTCARAARTRRAGP